MATPIYITQPKVLSAIFLSFLAVTLPMLYLDHIRFYALESVMLIYFALLGVSHFCLTGLVYFDAAHLAHFKKSFRNQVIYFYVPFLIFWGFYLYQLWQLYQNPHPLNLLFLGLVRFLDFQHVSRQSYGLLQFLKYGFREKTKAKLIRPDFLLFQFLAAAQLATFLNGGQFNSQDQLSILLLVGFVSCLLWTATQQRHPITLFYLLLQCAAGLLAVYQTKFYLASLAIHYVESHFLMYPRIQQMQNRGLSSKLGRPLIIYGVLLFFGLVYFWSRWPNVYETNVRWVNIFDGLFLAHYFLEAFVWRFRDPFYREQVLPLYSQPRPI